MLAATVALAAGVLTEPGRSQDSKAASIDRLVRADFMAGMGGDKDAFARALKTTEEAIKENPKNAEALAWQAVALWYQTGVAFQSGDMQKTQELFGQAMEKFDTAVQMAPDSVSVRSTRGRVMVQAIQVVPDEVKAQILALALEDYSKLHELQKESLGKLSAHAKGELLMGLAVLQDASGEKEKAQELVRRVAREMAGTPYGATAKSWMEGGAAGPRVCLGCHTEAGK